VSKRKYSASPGVEAQVVTSRSLPGGTAASVGVSRMDEPGAGNRVEEVEEFTEVATAAAAVVSDDDGYVVVAVPQATAATASAMSSKATANTNPLFLDLIATSPLHAFSFASLLAIRLHFIICRSGASACQEYFKWLPAPGLLRRHEVLFVVKSG